MEPDVRKCDSLVLIPLHHTVNKYLPYRTYLGTGSKL